MRKLVELMKNGWSWRSYGKASGSTGSPNGTKWSLDRASNYTYYVDYFDEAGIWLCEDETGSYRSTNGVDWEEVSPGPGDHYIVYHNGVFMDFAYADSCVTYSSVDCKTWTEVEAFNGMEVFDAYVGGGSWLVTTDGGIYRSTDCETWDKVSHLSDDVSWISYLGGLWIASDYDTVKVSRDGMSWDVSYYDGGMPLECLAHFSKGWLAYNSNSGSVVYSKYGTEWIEVGSIERGQASTFEVDGELFIYVWSGSRGGYITYKVVIGSGDDWRIDEYSIDGEGITDMLHRDGVWVACGDSHTYYSTDRENWNDTNLPSGEGCYMVYHENGVWVVSPSGQGLWYSFDGINWHQSNITEGYQQQIAYGDGVWIAMGFMDGVYHSDTWRP